MVPVPTDARSRFDLSGRIAVVTGGTRGLGLAIAQGFADAGAHVVIVSRKADACDRVAAEIRAAGGRALSCPCHVARWDAQCPGGADERMREGCRVRCFAL